MWLESIIRFPHGIRIGGGSSCSNVSQMKWVKMKTVDFPLEAVKYKSNYAVSSLWMCGASLMLFIQPYKFSSYWLTLANAVRPFSLYISSELIYGGIEFELKLVRVLAFEFELELERTVQAHQLPFHTVSFYPLITAKLAILTISMLM